MTPTVWQRLTQTGMVFLVFGIAQMVVAVVCIMAADGDDPPKPLVRTILATFTLAAACLVIGALGAIWT